LKKAGINAGVLSIKEFVLDPEIPCIGREPYHFINISDILFDGVSQCNWYHAKGGEFFLELPHGVHAIYAASVKMMVVERQIEIVIEISDDATGDGDCHASDIDKDVQFVLEQATDGDEEVVF
jgi:hypothetical protein